jgi:hypothetical protein
MTSITAPCLNSGRRRASVYSGLTGMVRLGGCYLNNRNLRWEGDMILAIILAARKLLQSRVLGK